MSLKREIGLPGAVFLGLGSIVGTGVFVSLGIAAGVAGERLPLALAIAAALALLNGLSSAQLAAHFPVSGGTYEYGYRLLGAPWGFAAGWLFLCAKAASCATAALGVAGYGLGLLGVELGAWPRKGIALVALAAVTALSAGGIKRSSLVNAVIVSITLMGLAAFVGLGFAHWGEAPAVTSGIGASVGVGDTLAAAATMFVAYTGYGRIATLGEEVRDPVRTIPRAIVVTLVVTLILYLSVAYAALGSLGSAGFAAAVGATGASLVSAATALQSPTVATILGVASVTAMLGVMLNLVLGLSRVVLAMARRGDFPARFGAVEAKTGTPQAATYFVAGLAAVLLVALDFKGSWTFSAFMVLIYYALTNLAALRLPPEARRFPRVLAWLGLAGCLGLAYWIDHRTALVGLGFLGASEAARRLVRR